MYRIRLVKELREERSLILLHEELLWLQKSRIDWLKMGDGNTKFFHTSALIRRCRNIIEALLDSEGRWVEGKESLKNMAVEFYTNLFNSDLQQTEIFMSGRFLDLKEEQKATWEAECKTAEIMKAV